MKPYKKAFIEITNVCNLDCDFCKGTPRPDQFMTKELFDRIISEAAPLTAEVVLHILGEPLLHPDLEYFIDQAIANNLSVMITTNGTLLDEKMSRMLASKKIRQINISLHALNDAGADSAAPLEAERRLRRQIFESVKLIQHLNPDCYINLRHWDKESIDPQWKSELVSGRVYLHTDTRFEWPDINSKVIREKGFCYGLSTQFGVLVDGTVVPCCLDADGIINLGNINQDKLANILNSPRAKNIRKGFQERNLIEPLCQRCGYATRFN